MDTVFEKARGVYVPQIDRFKVRIVWLFHPDQIANATYQDWTGAEPQVWQMIENDRRSPTSYSIPIIQKSDIPGLMEIHFGKPEPPSPEQVAEAKKRGWNLNFDSHAYVEMPGSAYSLLMDCNGGVTCTAHVHITESHLQYRATFPSEAVAHAPGFIASMNSMVTSWIRSK